MLTYYNDDITKGHYFGTIIIISIELVKSFFRGCYGIIIIALFVKIINAHVKLTTCFFDRKVIY